MRFGRFALLSAAAVAACAAPPVGPMVQVMPAPGKPMAQFQDDELTCRSFANAQTAGQAQAANRTALGGAVLSTALGAGIGAIAGGGRGAAVGAATGAGLGVGLGAGGSANSEGGIQYRYDTAYAQCMYAHGNQVPGFAPVGPAYAPGYEPAAGPGYAVPGGLTRAVQVELNRLGYMRGPEDGVAGPQTVSAIQTFQAAHGLPPDGVPTPMLLDELRATPPGA